MYIYRKFQHVPRSGEFKKNYQLEAIVQEYVAKGRKIGERPIVVRCTTKGCTKEASDDDRGVMTKQDFWVCKNPWCQGQDPLVVCSTCLKVFHGNHEAVHYTKEIELRLANLHAGYRALSAEKASCVAYRKAADKTAERGKAELESLETDLDVIYSFAMNQTQGFEPSRHLNLRRGTDSAVQQLEFQMGAMETGRIPASLTEIDVSVKMMMMARASLECELAHCRLDSPIAENTLKEVKILVEKVSRLVDSLGSGKD